MYHLLYIPASKFAESFVDNVIRDRIPEPAPGSVVYCSLAMGYVDHSGIYVGRNEIVHLDGSGRIEIVSPEAFLNRLGGLNPAISIRVSCAAGKAVGSEEVAGRARRQAGRTIDYRLLSNNCHVFTAGCLSGDFDNWSMTMTALKSSARTYLGAREWRVWDQSRTPTAPEKTPAGRRKGKNVSTADAGTVASVPHEPERRTRLSQSPDWPFPTSVRATAPEKVPAAPRKPVRKSTLSPKAAWPFPTSDKPRTDCTGELVRLDRVRPAASPTTVVTGQPGPVPHQPVCRNCGGE